MSTQVWSLQSKEYVQRIWHFRYFWSSLVKKDIQTRYRHSTLGIGWSLVRPLAMATVMCLVFSKIIDIPLVEYAPFLLIGLTVWQYLVECVISGCACFQQGAMYIRQQPVPLIIFPLRTALGAGLHASIALMVAVVITGILRGFPGLYSLVMLIPPMILCFILGWSLAVLAGLSYSHFPDCQHIFEIALQMLFYLTPVLYPAENFASRHRLAGLLNLNPLTHVIALFRVPLIQGTSPGLEHYLPVLLFVLLMVSIAYYSMRKLERTLVFWI